MHRGTLLILFYIVYGALGSKFLLNYTVVDEKAHEKRGQHEHAPEDLIEMAVWVLFAICFLALFGKLLQMRRGYAV